MDIGSFRVKLEVIISEVMLVDLVFWIFKILVDMISDVTIYRNYISRVYSDIASVNIINFIIKIDKVNVDIARVKLIHPNLGVT